MSQLRKMERRKQKKLHLLGGEEALKNINKGKMGIFNFGYQVLDVKPIRYSQHLACMRRSKLRSYLSKHRSLRDKCFLEARKLPRFCKTKNNYI